MFFLGLGIGFLVGLIATPLAAVVFVRLGLKKS